MRKALLLAPVLAASLAVAAVPARARSITGNWQGTVQVGKMQVRLVLHIRRDAAGALKARLNNLDPEHSASIPVTAIALHGSRLTFSVASMNASYAGVVAADGKSIAGKWTTQGRSEPVEFTRMTWKAVPVHSLQHQAQGVPYRR